MWLIAAASESFLAPRIELQMPTHAWRLLETQSRVCAAAHGVAISGGRVAIAGLRVWGRKRWAERSILRATRS